MPSATSRIQNAAGLSICHLSREGIGAYGVLQSRGPDAFLTGNACCMAGARLSDLTDNVHVRGPQDQVGEKARATSTAYVNLAAAGGEEESYYCITR